MTGVTAEKHDSFISPIEGGRVIMDFSGKELDVSFVVLDPRQEEAGTWGMDYFLKHVRSRYIFPMHCWNNYRMIREYKAKNDAKYPTCEIMGITGPVQEFVL